jgi:hypothetical protein
MQSKAVRSNKTIKCKITFYCDNLGLIKRLAKQEDPKIFKAQRQTLKTDYDIINTIVRTRQEFKHTIRNKHVKGHQDKVAGHVMTRPEVLNTRADKHASKELEWTLLQTETPNIIPMPNNVYLVEVDVIQSSGERNTVEQAAEEYELQQYIQARHRWTLQTLQSVDWDAYNSSLRSLESNT